MSEALARVRKVLTELTALAMSPEVLAWAAVALGCGLRLASYCKNRSYWLDERMLREGVGGRPVFDFGALPHDQLAPPGFLVAARLSWRLLGGSSYAVRLLPLAAGLASVVLLRGVARRLVSPAGAAVALFLAALSDDLVYYSGEFKQYSCDLAIALGCWRLAVWLDDHRLTPARRVLAAASGALAVWCSHPSVFVLAAAGLWLAGKAASTRDWRRCAGLAAVGLVWVANFAGCYAVSQRLLGPSRFMWTWWGFAFLPLPPRGWADAVRDFWRFVNVFTDPVGMVTPAGPLAAGLGALAAFAAGTAALCRGRRWRTLTLLGLPIAAALAASSLQRYPFHGRLLLYLVPSFLLPAAEGFAVAGRRLGRGAMLVLLAPFLAAGLNDGLDRLDHPVGHVFDSHGDQRNDLLDYLEPKPPPPPPGPKPPGDRTDAPVVGEEFRTR